MGKKIKALPFRVDTTNIYWNLRKHPELWNQYPARTNFPSSPHWGLDDIWARWTKPDHPVLEPGEICWYPSADILGVKDICLDIMHKVRGVELGGVLLTRIPPGKICKPHEDHGWHADKYDKFLVQITSAPGQAFHFEDESLETKPGDVAWFNNSYLHWVTNDTPYERISMVVCIKLEK